jgi:hypothetical protein
LQRVSYDFKDDKRDSRTSLSLAKNSMVGKSNERERAAERLKNFPQHLRLLIIVNRNAGLQRKGMEIATFLANSHGAILPPLLFADGGYSGIFQGFYNTL